MARRRYGDDYEDDDDFDDDDRRNRRYRGGKRQSGSPLLWVGLGVGGFLLLGACVVGGLILARLRNDQGGQQPGNVKMLDLAPANAGPIVFPELGPSRVIQPGVRFREATVRRGTIPMKVWYYRPEKAKGKLPLVLVPPAGNTLAAGMDLGESDRAEHFPYARAGFAVVSFEIDGNVPQQPNVPEAVETRGAREFRDAQAGLANARAALDFILAKAADDVDANRIYIAGHSSAATLALLFAEHEPRIKACVSYCAVTDVEARLAPHIGLLEQRIPGYRDFLRSSSPKSHADKLKCPLFLFHAQDDTNVPVSQTTSFAELVKKTNPNVTVVTNARGDHFNSMINEGIPQGIAWLKKLPA